MYLTFKDGKFKGYSEDKKVIKRFIKERKGDYTVHEIEKDRLATDFLEDMDFMSKRLEYYEEYNQVMLEEELAYALEVLEERMSVLAELADDLHGLLKYVKLNKSEVFEVYKFLDFINMAMEDITNEEQCVFVTDYATITEVLNKITGVE